MNEISYNVGTYLSAGPIYEIAHRNHKENMKGNMCHLFK